MPYIMYVALQGDDKLARFSMDSDTGKLTLQEEIPVTGGPTPLAVDPQRRFLYVGRRGACIISSFRIEPQTGRLTHIGEVGLASDPCYMSTDRGGRFVFSAYYEAGRAAVHPFVPTVWPAVRPLHGSPPHAGRTACSLTRPIVLFLCPTLPGMAPTPFTNSGSTPA